MKNISVKQTQRGAITIFICMVMLIFMTLMVITAFSMSSVNLQSVGNAQVRQEAVSAAQAVIEQVLATNFTANPTAAALDDFPVYIDGEDPAAPTGPPDFVVDLIAPTCVRATRANTKTASSVTLPGMTAVDAWNTVWELDATAINTATGTSVRVRQGVRKLLSEVEKNLLCS